MNSHEKEIESRLISLIKQYTSISVVSERDKPISNIIIEEYCNDTTEKIIDFKESIEKILFKYSNLTGEITDSVIYHLLYISLKVKIPIDNLLLDMLRNESLVNRSYQNKDVLLLGLKVMLDIPITYKNKIGLIKLSRGQSIYNSKTAYCLHFLEIFGRKEVTEGIMISLDNLLKLNIEEGEVKLIAAQMKSSLSMIEPIIFRKWYNQKIDQKGNEKAQIRGNILNEVLLRFVEISRTRIDFSSENWFEVFNMIESYSPHFLPNSKAREASVGESYAPMELFENGYKNISGLSKKQHG